MKNYNKEDALILIIGTNLRKIRISKGLTQEELGFKASISKKYISDFEQGRRNITIKIFQKLIEGLEITPQELFK